MGRLTALGAVAAAGLVLVARAGGAIGVQLSVVPVRPAALGPTQVVLRTFTPAVRADGSCCRLEPSAHRSYPFRVEAVSPAGKIVRVAVRPARANLWRGTIRFPSEGRWQIRVTNYESGGYSRAYGARPSISVRVRPPTPTPAPAGFGRLGGPGCSPASPARGDGRREIFGTAVGGEQLWALPSLPEGTTWADESAAVFDGLVGKEVKIVFAMTAVRAPFVAVGSDGARVEPVWRQGHVGPTWIGIPGHQWGAGFVFPRPGCWRIRVGVRGDLWLLIRS